jgi:hypothetical protein
MKVWTTLTPAEIRECAAEVGVQIHGDSITKVGRAWNFRLGLLSGVKRDKDHKYQRTSASGFNADRRVNAVCWHGHRDFMRALFRRDRDARIKSYFSDYKGSDDFEATFPETGYRNVGSMMYPMQMREVCNCALGDWDVELDDRYGSPNGFTTTMQQSDIRACKFVIFMPTHYRPDGSCKCDNAEHREMMIREWEYSPADFADIPLRTEVAS